MPDNESVWRRRAHRSDVVRFVSGRVSAAIGGDVNVVVVIGGFVAVVRRPARRANARVVLLPPDHVEYAPSFGIRQGVSADRFTGRDTSGGVKFRDYQGSAKSVGMPPQGILPVPADGGDLREQHA